MSISRRDMLRLGFTYAAGIYFPFPKVATASSLPILRNTLSIVQGATDDTKTQFSIVHTSTATISANVTLQNGVQILSEKIEHLRFPNSNTIVTRVFFSNLQPNEDLSLTVLNSKGKMIDQRIFRTINPSKESFKFALCSCMDEKYHDPAIWNDLLAQNPDVIFFIGDSVYADKEVHAFKEAPPATLWRRFAEARNVLEIYHQKRLTPIMAVWDDHDFGENDSNSNDYPYVKESQKNFLTFFPQNPEYCRYLARGPGISSAFTFGDHQIILMDDRSYRLPSGSKDRYAHWGKAQEEWAFEKIMNHREITWLANGSQFFPSVMWKESVSRDHEVQLTGFVRELNKTNRKVIFASGDVHYSEISRIESEILGYETFEVTSSSIHSQSVPGFPGLVPNHRRIMSEGDRNYILVKGKIEAGQLLYKVQSRSKEGAVRFQKTIAI